MPIRPATRLSNAGPCSCNGMHGQRVGIGDFVYSRCLAEVMKSRVRDLGFVRERCLPLPGAKCTAMPAPPRPLPPIGTGIPNAYPDAPHYAHLHPREGVHKHSVCASTHLHRSSQALHDSQQARCRVRAWAEILCHMQGLDPCVLLWQAGQPLEECVAGVLRLQEAEEGLAGMAHSHQDLQLWTPAPHGARSLQHHLNRGPRVTRSGRHIKQEAHGGKGERQCHN